MFIGVVRLILVNWLLLVVLFLVCRLIGIVIGSVLIGMFRVLW